MKKILVGTLLIVISILLVSCNLFKHEHTFSKDWMYDSKYHWHESSCSHDVTSTKSEHVYENNICAFCNYKNTNVENNGHEHAFYSDWIYDNLYHWHESSCGHDITSAKSEHDLINNKCSTCKYVYIENSDIIYAKDSNGVLTATGAYGYFDDLTKNESYLGYGFNVINSSVFSDKYVLTSNPIFNTEQLLQQRLVKVNSRITNIEEISSSTMEEYIADWNAKLNVDVEWGKKKVGGSVEVNATYNGGKSSTKSQYYQTLVFNEQKFYIVLQCSTKDYRNMLSEAFKEDLYSDMEPAELFRRYGTHFITSAVMGGKIYSYYYFSSDEEKDYTDITGQVSVEVRALPTQVNVDLEGGYHKSAREQNISYKNTLEVLGGTDIKMISDIDIAQNYQIWLTSLDEYASLIGIKDTGSLRSIWELIDPKLDTRTYTFTDADGKTTTGSRKEQLEAYFYKQGLESYNELLRSNDLPEIIEPQAIKDVLVNNESEKNGYFEVNHGSNSISFQVLPENAVGYSKSINVIQGMEYAKIDEKNNILIDPLCPNNEIIKISLSAGPVRKIIELKVVTKYTVLFEPNNGEDMLVIKCRPNSIIDKPNDPMKKGYVFDGWYISPDFSSEKFNFEITPIIDNITLYAKWIKESDAPENKIYEVVVEIDGDGTYNSEKNSYRYNEIARLEAIPNAGYQFDGWYLGDNLYSTSASIEIIVQTDLALIAKFSKIQISMKIIFDVDGGNLEITEMIVYQNEKYGELPTPTKDGYIFIWWSLSKEYDQYGRNEYVISNNTLVEKTADHILYAHWKKKTINIVYDFCGGYDLNSGVDSFIDTYDRNGSYYVKDFKPYRKGYRFLYWRGTINGQLVVYGSGGNISYSRDNVYFSAVWEKE